jgi:hypothetical protein
MKVPVRALSIFDAARFLGAWQLQTWDILSSDGRPPTCPYGEDAAGWLMYTPDGRMSVTVSRRQRGRLSSARARKALAAEKSAAFDSYFSYSGSFAVEGDEVVHRVEFSLDPNLCGTEQRLIATFDGRRRLTLSREDEVGGVQRTHRLVWQRPQG